MMDREMGIYSMLITLKEENIDGLPRSYHKKFNLARS